MESPVTEMIYRGEIESAIQHLRTQFLLWKKYSQRYQVESDRCQLLAANYHQNERKRTDGISDQGDVSREGNRILQEFIRLNSDLATDFWQEEATIQAAAKQGTTPTQTTPDWATPNPQVGNNVQPPNPQQAQNQHDPTHIYGRWQLVQVHQYGRMMPAGMHEIATYNRELSFELAQNHVRTAWGTFSYQGIELVINLANGMVDRRRFTCFGNSLLLYHEGSGVFSYYQRVG